MGEKVMCRVAAGPRIGFGHLVRMVSLCRALEAKPVVALRGGQTARAAAQRLGCSLVDGAPSAALRREAPDVLVVDDPSANAARDWVRAARRQRIPVAAIRDGGVGALGVDLAIDGSVCALSTRQDHQELMGPQYMVLDPVFLKSRIRRVPVPEGWRLVIMLGGGVHAGYATEVAIILEPRLGSGHVDIAPGFATSRRENASALRTGPTHARRLARADVALVAGGVGLYEVSCLGIPAVAVAVTPAQRPTIRTFAALGAVIDGGTLTRGSRATEQRTADRLATQVFGLFDDPVVRTRVASRARLVVDGRGGARVAAAVRSLAATRGREEEAA